VLSEERWEKISHGFSQGLMFGFSFIFVSLFGIYKAFLIVRKLELFVPSLSFLGLMWGSMLGGVCAIQQRVLRWIDKNSAKWGLKSEKNDNGQAEIRKYGDAIPFFALSFTVSWTLFEYLRGSVLLPFPWNFVCHLFNFEESIITEVFRPIVGSCGIYFLSTIWCLFVTSFFCDKSKSLRIISSSIIIGTAVFGIIERQNEQEDITKTFPVLYVESDIPQTEKIKPENKEAILQRMIDLTIKAKKAAPVPPRLIIWPETAITHMIKDENCEAIRRIREVANEYLIFGADRTEQTPNGPVWHNSMFVVSKEKVEYIYDKAKLLPFGEYTPLRAFFEKIAKKYGASRRQQGEADNLVLGLNLLGRLLEGVLGRIIDAIPAFFSGVDCTPGKDFAPLIRVGEIPPFTPYICSEIIHRPRISRGWIVHIYNTGWFTKAIRRQRHAAEPPAEGRKEGKSRPRQVFS
jgi:apolipoprotein N-acyltransferase